MVDLQTLLILLIPAAPLVGFLLISLNYKRLGRGATAFIACGLVLLSFLLSLYLFSNLLQLPEEQRSVQVLLTDWFSAGNFSVNISFLVDPLSILMLMIITGVGFLIHVYSIGYMHDDAGFNRFFSYLNLFVFFMLLLVMGSNYLILFIGWEGVGLCSYLLIGFWFKNTEYNKAANKAFIMNRIGDLGLLLGIILIFMNVGSLEYATVASSLPSMDTNTITIIAILLFIGAMGKSAQIPLFTWLPDAMAGPTPVSALIHAATMVTAGVYMVVRNSALYSLSPVAMQLILVIGLSTALLAALIAITQNDIKKVLAYSTVSQLGLMFVALGLGAFSTGIFHMATHAFFKALLFLGAGSVIHALHGEQDIRKMGGLRKVLPITYPVFLVGVLAIAGIPPFAGFFSKDEILAQAFAHHPIVWASTVVISLLTAFYMFRLLFLTFLGAPRAGEERMTKAHESPLSITIPLIILAILSTTGGFLNVPAVLGGSSWLHHFLHPVTAAGTALPEHALSHETEYMLMGVMIALTILVIFFAYNRYIGKKHVPKAEGESLPAFYRISYHKFYVDELYEAIIRKPLLHVAALFDQIVERLGIDAIVNGLGQVVISGSERLRWLQYGRIGFYVFIMVISIILILTWSVFII